MPRKIYANKYFQLRDAGYDHPTVCERLKIPSRFTRSHLGREYAAYRAELAAEEAQAEAQAAQRAADALTAPKAPPVDRRLTRCPVCSSDHDCHHRHQPPPAAAPAPEEHVSSFTDTDEQRQERFRQAQAAHVYRACVTGETNVARRGYMVPWRRPAMGQRQSRPEPERISIDDPRFLVRSKLY